MAGAAGSAAFFRSARAFAGRCRSPTKSVFMKKTHLKSISVSERKPVLLLAIRNIEKGYVYEVTKDNRKTAVIYPYGHAQMPLFAFSGGSILKRDMEMPQEHWAYDAHNLEPEEG